MTDDQTNAVITAWMPDRPGLPMATFVDYRGNACLVQPMLDRCKELDWLVYLDYRGLACVWDARFVVLGDESPLVNVVERDTLSEALTDAIVQMIEASKGETGGSTVAEW